MGIGNVCNFSMRNTRQKILMSPTNIFYNLYICDMPCYL